MVCLQIRMAPQTTFLPGLGLRLVIGLALGLGMGLVLSFPFFFQSLLSGTISSAQHYSYA